ncbi:MAG: tetratricopeptide repeat protein [Deltaproteobacteria bacterium]|nr:tetratricopeptide repeat protein [Deltaproteobacteria bacterium]
MATKAKGGSSEKKKKPAVDVVDSMAGAAQEPVTVAYDRQLLNEFVLGNITLGELEGIGKEVQYQIAERGYKLLNAGKLKEAEKIFKGLITLDPFDSYFHTVLGSIHQRQDMKDEAIEEYSRALKVNPFNATALANRGEIYFQLGRVLEATQDFQSAIENDPECKEPATLRCRVLSMALAKTIEENKEKILESMAKTKKGAAKKSAAGPAPSKPGAAVKPKPGAAGKKK